MSLRKYLVHFLLLMNICIGISGDQYVELKKGETLYRLSQRFGVSVEEILKANHINDVTDIPEGMKILIPGSGTTVSEGTTTYIIKKGDTLYSLARRYSTTVETICRLNHISDKTKLKVGSSLTLPEALPNSSGGPPSAPPSTWPHPGPRQRLKGILKGVVIEGQPGDFITAVAPGKVVWADPYRGFGQTLFIKSDDGYIYVYAGNEELLVEVGEIIEINRKIAILGKNPRDKSPKAYFFIYKNGKPIDPENRRVY